MHQDVEDLAQIGRLTNRVESLNRSIDKLLTALDCLTTTLDNCTGDCNACPTYVAQQNSYEATSRHSTYTRN